jgi:hypothetical protein
MTLARTEPTLGSQEISQLLEMDRNMSQRTLRVYFAHAMVDYNTAREHYAEETILRYFGRNWEIENPNQPKHQQGYLRFKAEHPEREFDYWTELAASCSALVFMAMPLGFVGSGVAKEAEAALDHSHAVYEVDRDLFTIKQVSVIGFERCLSMKETRYLTRFWFAMNTVPEEPS